MRPLVVSALAAIVLAACSGAPAGPVVVDQPGRVVVVHDPGPGTEPDASIDAAPDAPTEIVDAGAEAGPMTCTGPATKGTASTNCEPIGACALDTCTVGQAYACLAVGSTTPAGYPMANIVCVFSSTDSKSGGQVHCCETACVREDRYDGACAGKGSAIPHAMRCPSGVTPSVQHQEVTDQGVNDLYCTP